MELRNIAIIAHVDHGKTTLVDMLLRQSGVFRENQQVMERAMDSNELERERGITILAKCTSVLWRGARINIVDTPGHADFGGEVERILSMVDGCVVLVDAAEGALPQTKFVVGKALKRGLKPIVVINKIDRPDAQPHVVHDQVFDLFAALDATDEQLDFPTLFASGRQGWAAETVNGEHKDLAPLFDLIVRHVPPPTVDPDKPFAMLATILEANPYLGQLLTGRIQSGSVRTNMPVKALSRDGSLVESGRISKILAFRGLERVPVDEADAGDIVALAGLSKATVADTITDPAASEAIPAQPIDPPTITMTFSVNDSPLAGREGDKVTSRMIRDRLLREAEGNVALRISETGGKDAFEVAGRGELQLAILIEQMRREGFELSISRPRVVYQNDPLTGQRLEPIEEVVIDVDAEFSGTVVNTLSERKADLVEMRPSGGGKQRLVFHAPSRGLIGYYGEFLTATRGTGVMNRLFHGYSPYRGTIPSRRTGVLIANAPGVAVAYAMWNLEDRGPMMIEPQVDVYEGMIIGEHTRENDLDVNVIKGKQLTNIRAAGKDEAVRLTPPIRMTLEKAIAYIGDDELVEVTPKSIRLRKRELDPNARKRAAKTAAEADSAPHVTAPVALADIRQAAAAIAGQVMRTPMRHSRTLSAIAGCEVWLKFENLQFTASFKERGALNKLLSLSPAERARGVIAMSAGNHAQGVAYHATRLGIPATIVMPRGTPFTKIQHTQDHGARVLIEGDLLSESQAFAERLGAAEGLVFVPPYDDDRVIAGQGTVALEMLDKVPQLDTLIVPIGGGGLICGMATAAKATRPGIEVFGVQTALYPAMRDAVRGAASCGGPGGATVAEGIAVQHVAERTKAIIAALVSDIFLVDETALEHAVALLLEVEKTVAEGAGAAGLAALLDNRERFRGRNVGLVLTAGNIDSRLLASVILRELSRGGRISIFHVELTDRPGSLARITTVIGEAGGNIIEVLHNRLSAAISAKNAVVDITVETRDAGHRDAVGLKIGEAGFTYSIIEA